MLKYKLTNQNNKTFNNTKWEIGVPIETNGKTKSLCTNSWLHYYHIPELAILMNSTHANIHNPKLYECEAEGEHLDDSGMKGGCTKLTLIKQIEKPDYSQEELLGIGLEFSKRSLEYYPKSKNDLKMLEEKIINLVEPWIFNNKNNIYQELINFSHNINYKFGLVSKHLIANFYCNTKIYYFMHLSWGILNFCDLLNSANEKCDYLLLKDIIDKGLENSKNFVKHENSFKFIE